MQMVELKLNIKIDEDPYLMNAPDKSVNHPLGIKYCNIPFNKTIS